MKANTVKPAAQLSLCLHEISTLKELSKQENPHLYTIYLPSL